MQSVQIALQPLHWRSQAELKRHGWVGKVQSAAMRQYRKQPVGLFEVDVSMIAPKSPRTTTSVNRAPQSFFVWW